MITGIRRCGKSYMLGLIKEELINRGIDKNNIILSDYMGFDGDVFLMNFTVKTKKNSGNTAYKINKNP